MGQTNRHCPLKLIASPGSDLIIGESLNEEFSATELFEGYYSVDQFATFDDGLAFFPLWSSLQKKAQTKRFDSLRRTMQAMLNESVTCLLLQDLFMLLTFCNLDKLISIYSVLDTV